MAASALNVNGAGVGCVLRVTADAEIHRFAQQAYIIKPN